MVAGWRPYSSKRQSSYRDTDTGIPGPLKKNVSASYLANDSGLKSVLTHRNPISITKPSFGLMTCSNRMPCVSIQRKNSTRASDCFFR